MKKGNVNPLDSLGLGEADPDGCLIVTSLGDITSEVENGIIPRINLRQGDNKISIALDDAYALASALKNDAAMCGYLPPHPSRLGKTQA